MPLPRFVSLKASHVNMRVGPGRDYQVQWLYVRKGLPMEVIQEFGNWRKVRDPKGNEGWVLHSLLSNKRVTIITPWDMQSSESSSEDSPPKVPTINMYGSATIGSNVVAMIEAGTLGTVEDCRGEWCELSVKTAKKSELNGFVRQSLLWGVYPGEKVKN
ncbi:MAG: hypothetical protein L3J32_02360 [Rhizobiaceae bacterium]|nr:hypothetical protein [Rhizobiaceae bacterium]